MSIEWLIYWASKSDSISTLLLILLIILLGFFGLSLFAYIENMGKSENQITGKFLACCLLLIFFVGSIWLLIPSERTIYLMIGAHEAKESHIPEKVMTVINEKLNDFMKKEEK